jgi:hypothetical protein
MKKFHIGEVHPIDFFLNRHSVRNFVYAGSPFGIIKVKKIIGSIYLNIFHRVNRFTHKVPYAAGIPTGLDDTPDLHRDDLSR